MSGKERDRLKLVRELKGKRIGQKEAGRVLELSERQVRRILRRYEREGDRGLIHRLRGKVSKRKTSDSLRERVLGFLRDRYAGFGPTLASEYLESGEKISLSRETLRGWMIESNLWQARKARVRHRQWRERRACFGEMLQMDTSEHDWFEGRGESGDLIATIDDATSRLWAQFYPTDSTETNCWHLRSYLRRFGRPAALYVDKASHFQVNRPANREESLRGKGAQSQIQRALGELGIRHIPAHSPQAKGRVERLFGTLQDRLIKAMRLEGISTIAQANQYLRKKFIPFWNRRFATAARSPLDAHRPLGGYDLQAILCPHFTRQVANDYTVRFERRLYQIERSEIAAGLRRSQVLIEKRLEGGIRLRWRERYLSYKKIESKTALLGEERAGGKGRRNSGSTSPALSSPKRAYRPPLSHPWKRTFLSCTKPDISILR